MAVVSDCEWGKWSEDTKEGWNEVLSSGDLGHKMKTSQ